MHLSTSLPPQVELGAIRDVEWATEVVTTDGGFEVRNARWSSPLRKFEVSFPTATRDDPVYTAVIALYELAQGSLHSFDFADWTNGGEVIKVRFDSPLKISGVDIHHDHIETLNLVEVRE